MTAILVILLIVIVVIASQYFTGDETPLINENQNVISSDINIVKPLDIVDKSSTNNEPISLGNSFNQDNQDNKNQRTKASRSDETDRTAVLNNLGKNYVTMGEILDRKPPAKDGAMENLYEDIQRAKYNLEISKEMAAMTKDIYYLDENGVRQMNQETLDKIHELRKKLIVQINFDIPANE